MPATPLSASESSVAETRFGRVRGVRKGAIHLFKGMPYGDSTAGSHRFRPPQPPRAWKGIRDALAYAPMAPQVTFQAGSLFSSWTYETEMSEDCLALNVWTPALRDGRKRPVMVWFHGGDFSMLSGSRNVFDGTRLCLRGDVVVVTLNHRLSLFGFMFLDELLPELAGSANPGMLDLVAALRWVRDNIAEFGGDPDNVTIFGQSGGGGKVSTMMAMPAAAGLFHRAVAQSCAYARNAHLQAMDRATATRHAQSLLAALDLQPKDAGKLKQMPADILVQGLRKALQSSNPPTFRPAADGTTLPAGPWWPQAPTVSAQVPLMIGSTATEMTMLIGSSDPGVFDLDEAGLRGRLKSYFQPDRLEAVIAHFRGKTPTASPSELYFAISTSALFRRGTWQQADLKAAQGAAAVYHYEVDWPTPVDGGKWGSPHSGELALVFDNVAVSASMVGTGPDAQKVADQISGAWIAFARTGNPNMESLPRWPAYEPSRRTTMVFDVQSGAVVDFRDDERKLFAGMKTSGPFD